jgi:translation elongation factor EF-1alpha
VRVAKGEAGQSIALALKRIRRNEARKGMVLLAPDATPKAVRRFTASVLILYHQSTIARGYQAQAHIGSIRQTVRILDIDKPFVRTGDRCSVVFEFIKVSQEVCLTHTPTTGRANDSIRHAATRVLQSRSANPIPRRSDKGEFGSCGGRRL